MVCFCLTIFALLYLEVHACLVEYGLLGQRDHGHDPDAL